MAKVVLSARVESELAGWVKVYAKRRDATVATVLEAALREFREACGDGVPVLEARTPRHAEHSTVGVPGRKSVVVPRPSEWERTMAARQARLNRGKG